MGAALRHFWRARRPGVEKLLGVAARSFRWYEQMRQALRLTPVAFAYDYMMRGGALSHERLRARLRRVADAVARAGGITRKADPAGLNLAAPVADGEQVVVPAMLPRAVVARARAALLSASLRAGTARSSSACTMPARSPERPKG